MWNEADLRERAAALEPAALAEIYDLFSGKAGCMTCHSPVAYDKKGPEDVGSGGAFKVPSLPNVSKTGPYFHDGRFKTLDETVSFMWDFYKKKNDSKDTLSDAEKRDLVAFLRTLGAREAAVLTDEDAMTCR